MNHAVRLSAVAAFIVSTTLSASAIAQAPVAFKATCQAVGFAPPEPLGDRDGHGFTVAPYSCQSMDGPFEGGIMTGQNIWESDKGSSVLIAGNGVNRKPGMSLVYVITEGKNTLTMADGKVTGYSGSVKGVYKLATGPAAPYAGKSFTSTFRSIGRGQFLVETTID
ncbi:hypothetical protein QTI66_35030 [Variovorax sp. J22R133]|uniref:hypothetical protein n=1 Tax=Variovorax brevis TaxID=3053503 RepID=UPI0025791B8A|nr:hypothetical protein [Variovorax sp. J22R133]MDM0117333.1 hypothetical protein [Variovorax sp. J22R133]